MDISVIIPTYNELENVEPTFIEISKRLTAYNFEVIYVDDNSQDGTQKRIKVLMKHHKNIVILERKKAKGLASAIAHGFNYSHGKIIGVLDADLSYDFDAIPKMINLIELGNDIVLGSRYLENTDNKGFSFHRKIISKIAVLLASINLKNNLTDPSTGFMFLRKEVYDENKHKMKLIGFKFIYELLTLANNAKIIEVGTYFKDRISGKSKFNFTEIINYLKLIFIIKFSNK